MGYNVAMPTLVRTPKSVPVPVPHAVAVPPKQDNRWKYILAAAIVLLLLLLLLLFSFGKGTNSSGAGTSGTEQTGMGQNGSDQEGHADVAGDANEESAATGSTDESSETNETTESGVETETGGTPTPAVYEGEINETVESEVPRRASIEDLLRQLDGEEAKDSSSEDRRDTQRDGNRLGLGDASVNFFGATGRGSKFVFAFDNSGSMSGRPLEAVKRELIQALEPLRSNHSFNIIVWNSTYEKWRPNLVPATQTNKADAIKFIEDTVATGGTEPREPLLASILQKPEVIFFMTDGEFSLNVDEIVRNAGRIVISTVQFSDGAPLAVLQELARRTNGDFMLIRVGGLSDAL